MSNNYRSYYRLILAPCAIAWSVVQQSVPPISLPSISIPKTDVKTDTGAAKRGGLKRITSFIIDQGIDDSRLDLAS
jgi:hypothetical protein